MENLQLLTERLHEYEYCFGKNVHNNEGVLVAADASTERVFLALARTIVCYEKGNQIWVNAHVDVRENECTLHHCPDLEALFIAYRSGELCLLNEETEMETVSCFEEGIIYCQWSPDEETLAVVTRDLRLCLMHATEWEVVAEASLLDVFEDMRLRESEITAEISWRGDGCFLGVSVQCEGKCGVVISDGTTLKFMARVKPECTLLGGIAWQPNGRHLYAVGRSADDALGMCLFEKNGLAHGSFNLRTAGAAECLAWSMDSQMLAIGLHDRDDWILQIWMRSNWHWYLKYEKRWDAEFSGMTLWWDAEHFMTLHIFLLARVVQHLSLNFVMETDVSTKGTAAVIDGRILQLTPFRQVIIPPPLSAAQIEFDASVQRVAFFTDSKSERVAAWLASNEVAIAVCANEDQWEEMADENEDVDDDCVRIRPAKVLGSSLQDDRICLGSHLIWLDAHTIAIFGRAVEAASSKMLLITLETADDGYRCVWSEPHPLPFDLAKPIGVHDCILLVQSPEGKVYTAAVTDLASMQLRPEYSFPLHCPFGIIGKGMSGTVVVGMTSGGCIYHNGTQLMERATSMAKHIDRQGVEFLLITTKDNRLLIKSFDNLESAGVSLANGHKPNGVARPMRRSGATAGMHAAMTPALTQLQTTSFFERSVEMGARIIASPPGGLDVVLQMPRGNLEVISLRLFVLREIMAALIESNFRKAWQLATMHRVDLNVLVDFKWPEFLSKTRHFIAAVPSSDEICDLMTALEPRSLFETGSPYFYCLPNDCAPELDEANVSKVTTVCEALRTAMIDADKERYCKAIAISYARCDPPDLEHALLSIKAVRMQEIDASTSTTEETASPAGEAMKHLMLYVETSELYRVALRLYDLGLAYMVVTHAQRDPGEYLIELEQFASLEPESYRCAMIDLHLHRYSHALEHLVASGADHLEDAVELAEEHHLFHELLSHMESGDVHRKEVLKHYGQWLKSRGMQQDAGVAFLAAEEWQCALEAYQSCGEWQMSFILAGKLQFSPSEIHDLALEIVEELKSMERFADAAQVCLEYLEDNEEEAIALLTQARQWREALRICHRSNTETLVESIVAPAAAIAAESYLEDLAKHTEDLQKYFDRLQEVRKKRQTMENVVGHTGIVTQPEEEEEASTVAGLSLYTDRTHLATTKATSSAALTAGGKKPRKSSKSKKAKKFKIKQGSPEEETALIAHLHQLHPDASMRHDISQLMELLIFLGFFDDARKLQSSLDCFIKSHRLIIDQISGSSSVPDSASGVRWKWDILRQRG